MVRRLREATRGDDGSVTVEAALGIASIISVFMVVLAAMGVMVSHIQVVDAAREAARTAAIEGPAAGVSAGRQSAPNGAHVAISGSTTLTATVVLPIPVIPGVRVQAVSVVRAEPGAVPR